MTTMPLHPGAATIELVVRTDLGVESRHLSFHEAAQLGGQMFELMVKADGEALKRRVKLGAFLLQVHRQVPHGRWGAWLKAAAVHEKPARNAIKLAAELANEYGELDLEKLGAAVRDWNAEHPEHAVEAEGLSLHQAEHVVGIRKPRGEANRNDRSETGRVVSGAAEDDELSDSIRFGDEDGDEDELGTKERVVEPRRAGGEPDSQTARQGWEEQNQPPAIPPALQEAPTNEVTSLETRSPAGGDLRLAAAGPPSSPAALPQQKRKLRLADSPHQLTLEALYVGAQRISRGLERVLERIRAGTFDNVEGLERVAAELEGLVA